MDDTAKVYLERELGLERASALYGRAARIWQWRMRWFRSEVKEEQRVDVSPLGDLIGFQSVLKEDAPGARLSREEARARALAFLASRGLAASDLTPVEATPVERPNRTDWKFVDEKKGVRFQDATLRYATTVAGDRVAGYVEFVHVPEQWMRDYERLRSKNEAAGEIATAGLFVTVLAMLIVLVRKIVLKDVRWKLVAAFGLIGFVLQLLSTFNDLPLTLFSYDTASPLSAYLTNRVLLGVLLAIATGAGIALVVAAAEPIYRERFPAQLSLGGAFSARGIQGKAFLKSVVLGYALVAFFFAYQAVFYVVAARFGAWAPADVPYSDMLNTAFPWATVLLIGFLPAVTEEGISRHVLDLVARPARRRARRGGRDPRVHLGLRALDVPEPALLHPGRGGRLRGGRDRLRDAPLRRRAAARLALHGRRALHGAGAAPLGQRLLRRLGRGGLRHPAPAPDRVARALRAARRVRVLRRA